MPSSKSKDLTLGATGTKYTAPANGYFAINGVWGSQNSWIAIGNGYVIGYTQTGLQGASDGITYCPVKKGQSVYVNYYNITLNWFKFVYAEGDQ